MGQALKPNKAFSPVGTGTSHYAPRFDDARFGGVLSQADAVEDLNLTATNPPTKAEVESVADKVDELLASLRAAGFLASSGGS